MPLAISQPRGFEAAQKSKIQLEAVYTKLILLQKGFQISKRQPANRWQIPMGKTN